MELEYKQSESGSMPAAVEIGETTVYIRKNIAKETRINYPDETESEVWVYQEAVLSHEAFNKYTAQLQAKNAVLSQGDSENILSLLTGQTDASERLLEVLAALADIFESIGG